MADSDEESVWMRLVTNELLWVAVAAVIILGLAFYLATK